MSTTSGSNLRYYRTNTELSLGDRVEVKGWFGVKYLGYVSYIPDLSVKHEELEYEDVRQWVITSDDGTTYPILYDPKHFQPPKHIRFVKRALTKEIERNDELN